MCLITGYCVGTFWKPDEKRALFVRSICVYKTPWAVLVLNSAIHEIQENMMRWCFVIAKGFFFFFVPQTRSLVILAIHSCSDLITKANNTWKYLKLIDLIRSTNQIQQQWFFHLFAHITICNCNTKKPFRYQSKCMNLPLFFCPFSENA